MTIKFLRRTDGYGEGTLVHTLSTSKEDAYIASGAATRTLGTQVAVVSPSDAQANRYSSASAGGGASSIDFSTTLEFDADYDMGITFVAGAIALTADLTGAVAGKGTRITFVANASNVPTLPAGAAESAASFGYDNTTLGYRNWLDIWYDGTGIAYQWTQPATQTVITQPVAPAFSVAPSITGTPQEGVASAFTLGTLSAGSPTPSRTVQWTLDGVDVPGATSATYTPITADVGKALRVRDIATNASGTASSTSSPVTVTAASSLDADVVAWLARVSANGGTVSGPVQAYVNTKVLSAKAKGYWSQMARINLFVGDAAAAVVPLKVESGGQALDVLTNGATAYTYAEATGMTAAGASSYIDPGYIAPAGAVFGQAAYLRTTQTSDSNPRNLIGSRDSGSFQATRICGNFSATGSAQSGSVYGAMGGAAASQFATTGGLLAGNWHASRVSATSLRLLHKGVEKFHNTSNITAATSGVKNLVGAVNAAGTQGAYLTSGSSIGAYMFDTGMTLAQMTDYDTDMQAFQTAMGRQV